MVCMCVGGAVLQLCRLGLKTVPAVLLGRYVVLSCSFVFLGLFVWVVNCTSGSIVNVERAVLQLVVWLL